VQPPDAEEALDEVVDGTISAAIVEEFSLDCYQRRKPGRFQRLKVVQQSERFPTSVVAYRAGGLSKETLQLFRQGMCCIPSCPLSRHLLTWWRISGFEEVPAGYADALAAIAKAYPAPAEGSLTLHSLLDQANHLLGQWSSLLRSP
jgi:hypothetical protein